MDPTKHSLKSLSHTRIPYRLAWSSSHCLTMLWLQSGPLPNPIWLRPVTYQGTFLGVAVASEGQASHVSSQKALVCIVSGHMSLTATF